MKTDTPTTTTIITTDDPAKLVNQAKTAIFIFS